MISKVKILSVIILGFSTMIALTGCDIIGLNYSKTKARQEAFLYAAYHF